MTSEKEKWITVSEAATQLGVSEPTIYRLIRNKEIRYRKVLNRYSVAQSAVDEILRNAENTESDKS